ncbi:hypothetical protein K1T71_012065 [Dendrolimus kikuchii]|uniref:Uncharacterized protein n=1 Tax=Dendrolimus kikuchii TaxID=765133 RepID=A0ACC1CKS2_9NEOP|nr:hypothetical protein K1T71_012065 [Dendrolimus kikuchii]
MSDELRETYLDFEKICRVCLQTHKQTYDIYTSFYLKRSILYSDMLSRCTKLTVSNDDGLPRLICKDCSRQLKHTYTFNLQCEASDKKLKFFLQNGRNEKYKENMVEIKDESLVKNEKNVDGQLTNQSLSILDSHIKELNENIKIELPYELDDANDSSWDAEDDNCLLREIKPKKQEEESFDYENNEDDRPKKKRGRKKKLILEGDTMVPDSKLPHQCDICGKFLSNKSNLKAHKICHTNLRPYECPDCPATFRGHSALFQHRRVHSGETPYHCEYCPKQFSRRTNFVNHVRIHTGFPIKGDLRVHQRIHNGEKPYSCHLCSKTFATAGNLSIHVRIHNKEVRYNCKECHRGFVTCSAFNVHMKRHKGQRDYHCECGKTFYTSSALKQHKVVHTGEKKYQCKICDRKFTQTSHLSRHFKRDHLKPNAPVPSSEKYKIVIQDNSKIVWSNNIMLDNDLEKIKDSSSVKCEGP